MISTRIPKIEEFPKDGGYWRVDWFGAIQKNPDILTEPYFQVVISPFKSSPFTLVKKDLASVKSTDTENQQRTLRIGIGQSPLIWIGSIWKDGLCQPLSAGQPITFHSLNISTQTTRVISAGHRIHNEYLIPYNYYRFGRAGIHSKILAIEWDGDPYGILIPMMELLRFYYAVSSNLSHAIFSGALKHDLDSIVHVERTDYIMEERRFLLGLRQHITDEEGWVIARILNSREAWVACSQIHDNLIKQTLNSNFTHIETRFPFIGDTDLQARYKPIKSYGDKWRHLVLALEFCSGSFPYDDLTIIRDNDGGKADPDTDLPSIEKKPINRGKSLSKNLSGKELQSKNDTDKNISTQNISVPTNRFSAIENRKPDKPTKKQCEFRSSARFVSAKEVVELGTGLGVYDKRSQLVQPVNLSPKRERRQSAPPSFELFTEAVTKLNQYSEIVANLRTLDESVKYMPLVRPSGKWQWSYLNSSIKQRRHIIVADINYLGNFFMLVEFEMRLNERCTVALIYSGVHRLTDRGLWELLLKAARKHGIWANVDVGEALRILPLKHTWSDSEMFSDSIMRRVHL